MEFWSNRNVSTKYYNLQKGLPCASSLGVIHQFIGHCFNPEQELTYPRPAGVELSFPISSASPRQNKFEFLK